jgi:hypothetical protein
MVENITNQTSTLGEIGKNIASGLNLHDIWINSFLALGVLILGIIIGKLISFVLKNLTSKLELHKYMQKGFVDLTIVVLRWSIYLAFLHSALRILGIPIISDLFGSVLITVPAFIASLVILGIGFAIATYLKWVFKETDSSGEHLYSKIVFYFVLYVFGSYALKVAFLPFTGITFSYVLIVLSLSLPIAFAILYLKKPKPQSE